MKKFLSMVMAAAMVVSLVPATAFAAGTSDGVDLKASASIVGAENFTDKGVSTTKGEVQLKITDSAYTAWAKDTVNNPDYLPEQTFTLMLDNAKFASGEITGAENLLIRYYDADGPGWSTLTNGTDYTIKAVDTTDLDEVDITLSKNVREIQKNDIIAVTLKTDMTKTSDGKSAKVSVESDDISISNGTDLVYATVGQAGVTASVRKTVDIAVEESNTLEDVTIKPAIGDKFQLGLGANDEIRIRVSGGFEFVGTPKVKDENGAEIVTSDIKRDDDEITITLSSSEATAVNGAEKLVLEGVKLDASSAKEGAVASLKIYVPNCDTVSVEVAKVVGSAVTMSVDEDADVPVFYSSTNLDNTGITNYDDHESLEVTIEETFAGAWNVAKDWTLTLPEGVYAVATTADNVSTGVIDKDSADWTPDGVADFETWFADAYTKGDYDNMTFKKRTWQVTEPGDDLTSFTFQLRLVADPNFEGDVTLTLEGEGVDTQTVTIAKFVKPYTVEAQQNDLQIDYRNTAVGSNIVIKEAEAGLWKKDTVIAVSLDKIDFDKGATVTVDEKSGMEVKNVNTDNGVITFRVDKVSADEPATITISDLELYMDRSLPAGKYDLKVYSPTMLGSFDSNGNPTDAGYLTQPLMENESKTVRINDLTDRFYDTVVKEGFINIVTAGREDADSFTTKLVIPIGSTTMTAGENQVTLDAPAYISADGYTMLPLRAVATALGIPNESVLWDGATRTVTIMYGSKVIVMTVGQKTMYLNGSPVPASAAPEITNERTFLPVRDLGTALGVSDLTWDTDPATGKVSTVYVNANK